MGLAGGKYQLCHTNFILSLFISIIIDVKFTKFILLCEATSFIFKIFIYILYNLLTIFIYFHFHFKMHAVFVTHSHLISISHAPFPLIAMKITWTQKTHILYNCPTLIYPARNSLFQTPFNLRCTDYGRWSSPILLLSIFSEAYVGRGFVQASMMQDSSPGLRRRPITSVGRVQ